MVSMGIYNSLTTSSHRKNVFFVEFFRRLNSKCLRNFSIAFPLLNSKYLSSANVSSSKSVLWNTMQVNALASSSNENQFITTIFFFLFQVSTSCICHVHDDGMMNPYTIIHFGVHYTIYTFER